MKESRIKKIIVTGASGFIGRACIKQLLDQSNFEIHAISSKKQIKNSTDGVLWYQVDIFDTERIQHVCKEIQATYLLHLAWDVSEKKYNSKQHYNWIKVGVDLVEAFTKYGGKRIVAAGTCVEYDWSYKNCSEDSPLKPQNAYGIAKHKLQELLNAHARQNNISFVWGRIFFAYGPNENSNNIIPYIIRSLKEGHIVTIKRGNDIRDYIFIDDVAKALVTLIDNEIEGAVNISSDTSIKIKDLALNLAGYFNKTHLIKFEDGNSIPHSCIVGEDSRLQKELNWKPIVSLDKGLKKTIQFLEQ